MRNDPDAPIFESHGQRRSFRLKVITAYVIPWLLFIVAGFMIQREQTGLSQQQQQIIRLQSIRAEDLRLSAITVADAAAKNCANEMGNEAAIAKLLTELANNDMQLISPGQTELFREAPIRSRVRLYLTTAQGLRDRMPTTCKVALPINRLKGVKG